ncbi:MAG: NifU family protein [Bacteroidia bacterium]|nr:NifU family protein [Bacteroidia bacterium]MDW8158365.1 NifU family protein [Bacteroidia bacterium]
MSYPTLEERVQSAIESIRAYLQADGGDIRLINIQEDSIVQIEFLGACRSCNMNELTLRAGVEAAIKKAAPEIRSVVILE